MENRTTTHRSRRNFTAPSLARRLLLCLLGMLVATSDTAQAQAVTVVWSSLPSRSDSALVFNAYIPADTSGRTAAIYLTWPFDSETQRPVLQDFLLTLGISNRELQIIASALDLALFQLPTGGGAWETVLAQLRTLETVLARGGIVRFEELPEELKRLYAEQGLLTATDPRFPHLQGGYLVAYDAEGRFAMDGVTIDFGEVEYTQAYVDTVQFANLGRYPIAVTTAGDQGWDRGFMGPNFTLAPGERRPIPITFRPYLYAREARSSITVRYEGGVGPGVSVRVAGGRHDIPMQIAAVHAHLWGAYLWYRALLGVLGGSLVLLVAQLIVIATRTLGGRRLPRARRRTWTWQRTASPLRERLWTRAAAGLAASWQRLKTTGSEAARTAWNRALDTNRPTRRPGPAGAFHGNGDALPDQDVLRLRREHTLKRAAVSRKAVPRRGLRSTDPAHRAEQDLEEIDEVTVKPDADKPKVSEPKKIQLPPKQEEAEGAATEPDEASVRVTLPSTREKGVDDQSLEAQCLAQVSVLRAMMPPGLVPASFDRKAVRRARRLLKKLIRQIDREVKKVEVPKIEELDKRNAARNVRDLLGETAPDKQILMLWLDNLELALQEEAR